MKKIVITIIFAIIFILSARWIVFAKGDLMISGAQENTKTFVSIGTQIVNAISLISNIVLAGLFFLGIAIYIKYSRKKENYEKNNEDVNNEKNQHEDSKQDALEYKKCIKKITIAKALILISMILLILFNYGIAEFSKPIGVDIAYQSTFQKTIL